MTTFAKTRAAASYAAQHGPQAARGAAAWLLKQAAACQDALDGEPGQPPAVTAGLLHALVLAAGELTGPAWLAANEDDPDVAAFAALQATASPPDPGRIDDIISRVLWARFAPTGAGSWTSSQPDPPVKGGHR